MVHVYFNGSIVCGATVVPKIPLAEVSITSPTQAPTKAMLVVDEGGAEVCEPCQKYIVEAFMYAARERM